MKNVYLTFCLATFAICAGAQIPNNGFEDWTNNDSYLEPSGWSSLNAMTDMMSVYTCQKGIPGNPGEAYVKLTSKTVTGLGVIPGVLVSGAIDETDMEPLGGFAFTDRPESFGGSWQHMIFGTSQGFIDVQLTIWNSVTLSRDVVAVAHKNLTGMAMSWANFSIDFDYMSSEFPDSCIIFMSASGATPANQDYLWVDDLAFSGEVVGVVDQSLESNFLLFPNPSTTYFNVVFHSGSANRSALILRDVAGKILLVKTELYSVDDAGCRIPTEGLAPGLYTVQLVSGTKSETQTLVIH